MAEKEMNTLEQKYPNNSKKAKELVEKSSVNSDKKEESKKVQKVIKGKVKQKKKSKLSQVGDELVEDSAPSVLSYVLHDVAIPAFKELIFDIICGGTEKFFFGTESGRNRSHGGNRKDGSYVSYTSYYDRKGSGRDRRDERTRSKGRFHSEDYIFETRAEASDVIDQLTEIVDRYGDTSISDFKDAIGVTSEYTDENWGWTNLRTASIRAVRGGFVIHLPNPTSLL